MNIDFDPNKATNIESSFSYTINEKDDSEEYK